MAIQNDNTLVTKGDLKSLYTDKIAPYLGGGISYYYTDRTGEELKSIDMRLSASQTVNAGSTQNTLINFDKSSGTYETNNHKVIIPAGQRIQINVALQASPGASNAVDGEWQIYDYTNDIIISKANFTYIGSGYSWSSTKSVQYTAPENGALVGVKVTALFYNTSVTASSSFTIQEIGRIVDPIKYMDNNSDLEETPVGNIISYMGNSIPKHHLACDGTEYAIGTYSELEAHIIKEFGSINYFGGDGTTTWAVPDLNGEFLRGTGTNSHTNQGNGADVGVHQDSTEFPAYYTGIGADNKYYIGFRVPNNVTSSDYNIISKADKNISKTSTSIYGNAKEDLHGTASTSNVLSTIRPTNTSVKFCIKYESTYHVIVPSHMYKVSIPFSVTHDGTNNQDWVLDNTNIEGDASLVSGNTFIVPLTGWYSISSITPVTIITSTNTSIDLKVLKNGTVIATKPRKLADRAMSLTTGETYYLEKGDIISLQSWANVAGTVTGTVNFCLLTANHKDNIIAGGEVYSTEEQLVGTWTDGKPLYQKTIKTTLPSAVGTDKFADIGVTVDTIVDIKAQALRNNNYSYSVNGCCVLGDFTSAVMVNASNNNASSNKNKVGFVINKEQFIGQPVTVTVQYTKTTDTAGTYQYKNSLLLTRPDMWEPNTEYDFGGGLYGKRYTGNLSVTTTLTAYAIDATWKNKSYTSVSSGGWISRGVMLNACNGTLVYMLYKNDSQGLCIQAKDSAKTVSYDIWVTYRKA